MDKGALPPIALEVYVAAEMMLHNRAKIDTNWWDAVGMSWADNKLMVHGLSREEQIAYGRAILDGALAGLKEGEHDTAYKDAIKRINYLRDNMFSTHHRRGRSYGYSGNEKKRTGFKAPNEDFMHRHSYFTGVGTVAWWKHKHQVVGNFGPTSWKGKHSHPPGLGNGYEVA